MDNVFKGSPSISAFDSAQTPHTNQSNQAQSFAGAPEGEDIISAVRQYYKNLADDNYEGAVALMQPGMRVFTPYGPLMHLPDDAKTVVAIYETIHGKGFHMGYTALDIDGAVYGDVAFAAYLLQGKETAPGGATKDAVRRGTQVWVKENGQWRIAHMHVSTNDEWESWRGRLAAK